MRVITNINVSYLSCSTSVTSERLAEKLLVSVVVTANTVRVIKLLLAVCAHL